MQDKVYQIARIHKERLYWLKPSLSGLLMVSSCITFSMTPVG